jgi:spore coat polysaccharide biosynthesis protein SpsF (cytidylyltransferase family)
VTVGAIVLARCDSARLPGKVLLDLGGRSLLGRVLDRLRLVPELDCVVVATSDRNVDDPIVEEVVAEPGVEVFRGAIDDVLGRCLAASRAFSLERVVRISADSPFIDPSLIAQVIAASSGDVQLATNVAPRTFPPGTSVEVLTQNALVRLAGATRNRDDREHVTRYAYAHPDEFVIANVAAADNRYQGVNLTVDEPADLDRARWVVMQSGDPAALALDEVIALFRAWPGSD